MGFGQYVIENANQMNQLLTKAEMDPERRGQEMVEASVIGCRALTQLGDDRDFRRTVERMSSLRLDRFGSTTQDFKHTLEDIDSFEHFLSLEYEVLVKGGMDAELADKLVDSCRAAVSAVKNNIQPSVEVMEAIRTLRDQACERSRILVAQATNLRSASEMENQLWRITIGLAGAALIALNAAVAATTAIPSVGLTSAGAAVSAAFGGAIIKNVATAHPRTRTAGA